MIPENVTLTAGSFKMTLYLNSLQDMPLTNWRKFCKLLVRYKRLDDIPTRALEKFFPAKIQEAKNAWILASKNYLDGYRNPEFHYVKNPAAVARNNSALIREVKRTKRDFDRWTKMFNIFNSIVKGDN